MLANFPFVTAKTFINVDQDFGDKGGQVRHFYEKPSRLTKEQRALNHCNKFNADWKLNYTPVHSGKSWVNGPWNDYEFYCIKKEVIVEDELDTQVQSEIEVEEESADFDINEAIITCKDLGFKKGTEKFGECVLKLTE